MNKSRVAAIIGVILVFIQAFLSCMTLYRVVRFGVLADKLVALAVTALLASLVIVIAMQFFDIVNIFGKALSVIICVFLIYVYANVSKTERVLENEVGPSETTQVLMEVSVLKENSASGINDLNGAVFGITSDEASYENDKKVIELIEKDLGTQVTVKEYPDNFMLSKAMLKGEVGALIINSAYKSTLDEAYEALNEGDECYLGLEADGTRVEYSSLVKMLTTYTIEVESKNTSGFGTDSSDRAPISTSITPFVLYVSGIDVKGDISTVSRSDVNVIVCVNPVTKQILMVTTPRDSYVKIPGKTDKSELSDKLTHAGLYGVNSSIATLENIYGVDIDYYLRVNFTSVVDIVDLLGGVSVYSASDFRGRHGNFQFHKGYNDMNGEQALSFARERFTIAGGDYSRGRNHMELIKAILNKAMSPAILSNYSKMLDLIAENIETNMTTDEITELIRMQLGDGASWNFVHYATEGINGGDQQLKYCWSYSGSRLYVTILDEDSVAKASDLMEIILNGGTISQNDLGNQD